MGASYYSGGIQNALDLTDQITVPMPFHFVEIDPHSPLSAAHHLPHTTYRLREKFAGRSRPAPHRHPRFETFEHFI
jgi:hypothetical protein